MRSHSRTRVSYDARTRTEIIDHGNSGAWLGTTVACANDAEVLDGLLGSAGLPRRRLRGLVDALGCVREL